MREDEDRQAWACLILHLRLLLLTEEGEDVLSVGIGDRQRLDAKLLLRLKCLQAG